MKVKYEQNAICWFIRNLTPKGQDTFTGLKVHTNNDSISYTTFPVLGHPWLLPEFGQLFRNVKISNWSNDITWYRDYSFGAITCNWEYWSWPSEMK